MVITSTKAGSLDASMWMYSHMIYDVCALYYHLCTTYIYHWWMDSGWI